MLDWGDYERFDWNNAQQEQMHQTERSEIEMFAARVLELADSDRQMTWGSCSPPGRYAATVVRVFPDVKCNFPTPAAAPEITEIGVKIFKTTTGAQREGERAVRSYAGGGTFHQLPGLPNQHVQRIIDAGTAATGAGGTKRCFVVLEWIRGETLEDLGRRQWPDDPIHGEIAKSLIRQLFGEIVIPLWSVGTVWWDFRDANYCWNATRNKLTMIDVDSLLDYEDEIVDTPDVWTRRDKGRRTALRRLRNMTLRILVAQARPNNITKAFVKQTLTQAWNDGFETALLALGRNSQHDAQALLQNFLTNGLRQVFVGV
ncbi:MAG: hypothetical protein ABGZ35_10865 [Planctomycetaceae bacterium]